MSKIDDITRLQHMKDAAIQAKDFINGCDRQTLNNNQMLVFALIKAVEIIGEAAANISLECQQKNPQIPWSNIIGMRNRLVHAYFSIDLDILWNTVTIKLDPLIEELEVLLMHKRQ
ncbi:HepT-like ribonuclease domain-containing protein [Aphanothece sacrum]|uniref:Nucleotidyltransferase n=1 Tax=Aphanothece sacrum FPU1 TaxID=1920663 RepID=A0A401IH38_APHSA|nr:DUF86 domain-containing protein [Aphanothece sacrum]GBF80607.1 hypothetical protein AsFPU1_2011 [Aphanothece sacrum FPU1]GBF84003.1 hypothetical protein AsFPU3_1047 [Aphanothece sacrum FPU3]